MLQLTNQKIIGDLNCSLAADMEMQNLKFVQLTFDLILVHHFLVMSF